MSKSIYGKSSVNLTIDNLSFLSITTNDITTTNASVTAVIDMNTANASVINVSTITIDNLNISQIDVNTLNTSQINSSNASIDNASIDILSFNQIDGNEINIGTINSSTSNSSTINSSTGNIKFINASDVTADTGEISVLTTNIIQNNDFPNYEIINSSNGVTTINGTNVNASNINVSSINLPNTINVSTINASNGFYNILNTVEMNGTVSSIDELTVTTNCSLIGFATYDDLRGSYFEAIECNAPTINASDINTSTINASDINSSNASFDVVEVNTSILTPNITASASNFTLYRNDKLRQEILFNSTNFYDNDGVTKRFGWDSAFGNYINGNCSLTGDLNVNGSVNSSQINSSQINSSNASIDNLEISTITNSFNVNGSITANGNVSIAGNLYIYDNDSPDYRGIIIDGINKDPNYVFQYNGVDVWDTFAKNTSYYCINNKLQLTRAITILTSNNCMRIGNDTAISGGVYQLEVAGNGKLKCGELYTSTANISTLNVSNVNASTSTQLISNSTFNNCSQLNASNVNISGGSSGLSFLNNARDTSIDWGNLNTFGFTAFYKSISMKGKASDRTYYMGIASTETNASNSLGFGMDGGGGSDPNIKLMLDYDGTVRVDKNLVVYGDINTSSVVYGNLPLNYFQTITISGCKASGVNSQLLLGCGRVYRGYDTTANNKEEYDLGGYNAFTITEDGGVGPYTNGLIYNYYSLSSSNYTGYWRITANMLIYHNMGPRLGFMVGISDLDNDVNASTSKLKVPIEFLNVGTTNTSGFEVTDYLNGQCPYNCVYLRDESDNEGRFSSVRAERIINITNTSNKIMIRTFLTNDNTTSWTYANQPSATDSQFYRLEVKFEYLGN